LRFGVFRDGDRRLIRLPANAVQAAGDLPYDCADVGDSDMGIGEISGGDLCHQVSQLLTLFFHDDELLLKKRSHIGYREATQASRDSR
jgi:hypothetical protein